MGPAVRAAELRQQLAEQRWRLTRLCRRYGAGHPDKWKWQRARRTGLGAKRKGST